MVDEASSNGRGKYHNVHLEVIHKVVSSLLRERLIVP